MRRVVFAESPSSVAVLVTCIIAVIRILFKAASEEGGDNPFSEAETLGKGGAS
jgi:hypothetical protein